MQTIATLQSVDQQSSILVFTFISDTDDEYILYGDLRTCQPLLEYVNKQVKLSVNGVADWTWSPLDECEPESEV